MKEIKAPKSCPSCGSELVQSNYLLFCKSAYCGSRVSKIIEHFCKTLKIKGLGPATIEKLRLCSIEDIYSLTEDEICLALSSEKLGKKLYSEIQQSKSADLQTLLPAFSIPLIGRTASEKLSTQVSSINEINSSTCKSSGLGQKASANLVEWISTSFPKYKNLPFSWEFKKMVAPVEIKGTVCISGKLKTFKTKAEAAAALSSIGYTVKSSLTKDVTILVNESGIESAKTKKARESGITVIENLNNLFGE